MTCKVHQWGDDAPEGVHPGKVKEMIFSCDAEGCGVVADDATIISSGGLRFMGWYAAGGKHFCPAHRDQGGEHQW